MELIDCHAHTELSGHGVGSVDDMVDAARDLGLTTFALTEHLWLPEELDPEHGDSMTLDQMRFYTDAVHAAQQRLAQENACMELICGIEADWLDGRTDELVQLVEPFGYVVGSVHFVDGLAVDYDADYGAWATYGVDGTWQRYFEAWFSMAASDVPFTTFAHPDLPKKFGQLPSFDMREYYEEMAWLCASRNAMVEVNTAGFDKPCAEPYPSLELLGFFARVGVECTVGADAHDPGRVGVHVKEAYQLMRAAGYRYVTVPTCDGGRRRIRLED